MRILLINGSPRGSRSNSLRLAKSFIDGFSAEIGKSEKIDLEELTLASMKIGACKGCFACWKSTPGICCIKDDMPSVIGKIVSANLVVWSFPLYYFNVPGLLKNMIDRQLPMALPFMSERTDGCGNGSHDSRYDTSKTRHVLISTCGFWTAKDNYDSVTRMFDHFLGKDNYTTIFCGQGELFHVKELSDRTDDYLSIVKHAGEEYAKGTISEETNTSLKTPLYPKEMFEDMANASWGVSRETGEKEREDLIFTRQMAVLYNKAAYDGKDRVLEMNYTDLGTSYQILLGKDGSKVVTDGRLTSTTSINTPFSVWSAISKGEMEGSEALGKGLYNVTGDFSLMMNWNRFFGGAQAEFSAGSASKPGAGTENENRNGGQNGGNAKGLKNPSMMTMLIPWITFWIACAINPKIGALITLGVCALVPLIMGKHRLVIWDTLSLAAVATLSVAANITGNGAIFTNIGYLAFGLLWLGSCAAKEPLCATYVKYSYGSEAAFRNPLFMKTNYVLAAAWGVLYILTAVWTWFLRKNGFETLILIINNMVPIFMGIFTGWFQKWYPAHLARGKNTHSAQERKSASDSQEKKSADARVE